MAVTSEVQGGSVHEAEQTRNERIYRPNVDIIEKEHELVLLADMPGADAESIDVNFERGLLTIHGSARPRQAPDTGYLLREYGVGGFHREFAISEDIDASKIAAEFHDGVLTLHLPKSDAVRARKIRVRTR